MQPTHQHVIVFCWHSQNWCRRPGQPDWTSVRHCQRQRMTTSCRCFPGAEFYLSSEREENNWGWTRKWIEGVGLEWVHVGRERVCLVAGTRKKRLTINISALISNPQRPNSFTHSGLLLILFKSFPIDWVFCSLPALMCIVKSWKKKKKKDKMQ